MGTLVKGTAATYVEELWINTNERYEIRCITSDVQKVIRESGIVDGLVLVNPMHITASCFVNDLEYGLHHDIRQGWNTSHPSMASKVGQARSITITARGRITEMHT